jgi:hypothetical protein
MVISGLEAGRFDRVDGSMPDNGTDWDDISPQRTDSYTYSGEGMKQNTDMLRTNVSDNLCCFVRVDNIIFASYEKSISPKHTRTSLSCFPRAV